MRMRILVILTLFGMTATPWGTAADITTGLVGYWAFDEGEGRFTSNCLRSNPGLLGNSGRAEIRNPVWVEGKFGNALDFSGLDTVLMVNKTREMECAEQVTIAAWIKLKNPKARCMILNNPYSYRLCVNQNGRNRVRLQLNLNGKWAKNWLAGRTSLETGKWYYVAGTYNGRDRQIYINGKLDASEKAFREISGGRNRFTIGAWCIKRAKKRILKSRICFKNTTVRTSGRLTKKRL